MILTLIYLVHTAFICLKVEPDEIYNCSCRRRFVGVSFYPDHSLLAQITGIVHHEFIKRRCRTNQSKIKFYQASTSEDVCKFTSIPQNEKPLFIQEVRMVLQKVLRCGTLNYQESI